MNKQHSIASGVGGVGRVCVWDFTNGWEGEEWREYVFFPPSSPEKGYELRA